jgi:hypothetical protein
MVDHMTTSTAPLPATISIHCDTRNVASSVTFRGDGTWRCSTCSSEVDVTDVDRSTHRNAFTTEGQRVLFAGWSCGCSLLAANGPAPRTCPDHGDALTAAAEWTTASGGMLLGVLPAGAFCGPVEVAP